MDVTTAFQLLAIALGLGLLVGLQREHSASNLTTFKEGRIDPGLTTEIAIVLMYAVGAYLVIGHRALAIAVGGGVAVRLQFKMQMHGIVERLVATIVIMIASAVVFLRVLLLIAVVARPFLASAAPPILILFVLVAALAAGVWFTLPRNKIEVPAPKKPSELKSGRWMDLSSR